MLPVELSPRLILNVVDVVFVVLIAYSVYSLIRGTRAVQLLKGLLVLAALTGVAHWLRLTLLSWILEKIWTVAFVAVVIIFQPEIRRMLEKLGRGAPLLRAIGTGEGEQAVGQVAAAVAELARTRTGALIAFERETGLREFAEGGILLDALVSRELLLTIFEPHTALHDGAVIIRDDRVVAAGCFLPLAAQKVLPSHLGSRHRAAVGLSELTDALVVVVSEETGTVSLVADGKLEPAGELDKLAVVLSERLRDKRKIWGRGDRRRKGGAT
jgi:diadenylate cyclase